MAPSWIPTAGVRRFSVLAVAAGLLVTACSGSAGTAAPIATPTAAGTVAAATAAPSPTPAPTKGPATESLNVVGPAGATGAVTNAAVRCNFPATDGTSYINVIGQPVDPNLSVYINVSAGLVTVRFDSGSGSTYVERDFTGTGVTSFDAATGAKVDTKLVEVATTGAHGTLGVLTSLSGTIDCGNQTAGTSTLTLTGPTAKGALGGGLNPVNVECVTDSFGKRVSVLGVVQVASTPFLAVISISPGTASVSVGGDGFFRNTATAVATLTPTGAHVDADLLEQNPAAGTKANTIHMTGDVVCGTTTGG
jgi:hypothetical protein